ncbi:hypothetical protein RN001_000193 [Aquatica leii]|uniref:Uncharacterized protein n=1 Tax=Aquatica leii TaxID=1421715 RepID=A0AAN7SJ28_9COLE|nr:hypothetical protein RN001_000193 [Aquatica leii]
MLPTYADIIRHYLFIRQKLLNQNKQEPSLGDVCLPLTRELKTLWDKSSIAVVSDQEILRKIREYHKKYRDIKKLTNKDGKLNMSKKVIQFREFGEKNLLDISLCKCKDFAKCVCTIKVPIDERSFLTDQRTARKMAIGKIDVKVTKILEKKLARKAKSNKRTEIIPNEDDKTYQVTSSPSEDSSRRSSICSNESVELQLPKSDILNQPSTSQMRTKLPSLAQACDRTGVSDRSAAILVNSALKDLGIITMEASSKIIDRSKIRRERVKARKELKKKHEEEATCVYGIYFDGRKDKTLVQIRERDILSRKTITEEHIVLVSEPGSVYFGHITPSSGSAQNIKRGLLEFLEKNINISEVQAIGCDGTAVNTGHKNGILRQLELSLSRPLQWFVYGKTTGPKGYCGEIGKNLENCEIHPVVKFRKIAVSLPEIDLNELSTDQQYLYDICNGISKGIISSSLSQREPGKMAHSRWLTTANRLLRLYISTKNPSYNLTILTEYVMKVYAPTWFEIKIRPSYPVLQRNGYFGHPENLLLAMLADDRKYIRELGLRRILKCRQAKHNVNLVREFNIPSFNFNADDYFELVSWQSLTITEPPLTVKTSDNELQEMISDVPAEIEMLKFPCHSQAVERCVKLVTEASAAVCGYEARDGFIRSRIASRVSLPKFETKGQYCQVLKDN